MIAWLLLLACVTTVTFPENLWELETGTTSDTDEPDDGEARSPQGELEPH